MDTASPALALVVPVGAATAATDDEPTAVADEDGIGIDVEEPAATDGRVVAAVVKEDELDDDACAWKVGCALPPTVAVGLDCIAVLSVAIVVVVDAAIGTTGCTGATGNEGGSHWDWPVA